MWFQATFTPLRVDESPQVLNGGWWSPFRRQERIVSASTSVGTHVQLPATSKARYESDQSSDVVIWTRSSWCRNKMPNDNVTGLAPRQG